MKCSEPPSTLVMKAVINSFGEGGLQQRVGKFAKCWLYIITSDSSYAVDSLEAPIHQHNPVYAPLWSQLQKHQDGATGVIILIEIV